MLKPDPLMEPYRIPDSLTEPKSNFSVIPGVVSESIVKALYYGLFYVLTTSIHESNLNKISHPFPDSPRPHLAQISSKTGLAKNFKLLSKKLFWPNFFPYGPIHNDRVRLLSMHNVL